jgi:hypothetical protein
MTQNVKPSVEQEEAVRRRSETVSDKKTANKSEVFYSSVAYMQFEQDTKVFSDLHNKGHLNKLLKEAANYDHGDAIELDRTYKSPLQNKGDELLRENKNYAVVYNNSVGGTYEVFRKVPLQEVLMNVERYGLSENSTNDVKELIQATKQQAHEKQQANSSQSRSVSSSPIMKQYESLKAQHPDALLLFRVGDFYETYHKDAIKASKHLGITLTKNKEGVELAGFPHHALDIYLPKLVRAGERVAICDQLEAPIKKKEENNKQTTTKKDKDNGKEIRDDFTKKIVEVSGKNNHHAFVLPLMESSIKVEDSKGKEVQLSNMQVLRGRVTFSDTDGNKMQLRDFPQDSLRHLGEVIPPIVQSHKKEQNAKQATTKTNQAVSSETPTVASSDQQQKFIDDIKAAMGSSKMVVLPDFGTKKGVVAGTDEDKGISLNRVYAWNDNVSFAGSVPGDDTKKRRYYHPENIRPEFYNYLVSEVKKAVSPQLITENGQKVTSANLFESPKQEGKYFFYARLDGVGLHPKAVNEQDVDAYMKQEMSVKDMFSKYYPTKMAKQLDKEEFDSLKLSDGRDLTLFRVYKQRNEEKPHFGEYLMYAEMGDKRFHATPLSHDQLDAYFDRTQSKGQLAEKVIGEQLHLKSAYEKYRLPENISVQEIRVRKVPEGDWLISANLGDKGQTPERKVSNNDLYSLFKSKTATREQLGAKYLTEDIKELAHTKQLDRTQGLKV